MSIPYSNACCVNMCCRSATDRSIVVAKRDGSVKIVPFVRSGKKLSVRVIYVAIQHDYVTFRGENVTIPGGVVAVRSTSPMASSFLNIIVTHIHKLHMSFAP